jgi:phage anti-repressor protein
MLLGPPGGSLLMSALSLPCTMCRKHVAVSTMMKRVYNLWIPLVGRKEAHMSDLIPFAAHQLGTETVPTVNARDLYAYLQISKPYAHWIKTQLRRANLVQNSDYVVFALEGKNLQGGRPASEHHLIFDAAKHVALMSSADKGHAVRAWFIAKEKELAAVTSHPIGLLDRYPELRAVADLAMSTAQARALADAAKVEAEQARREARAAKSAAAQAENKADLALAEVRMMTLEDFVLSNGLLRQLPRAQWPGYVAWLKDFCQAYSLAIRKDPVPGRSWETENAYPLTALGALLRHEQTRPRQVTLIHPRERNVP